MTADAGHDRIEEIREWCEAKREQGIERHGWIVDQMEFLLGVIDADRERMARGAAGARAVLAALEDGQLAADVTDRIDGPPSTVTPGGTP